MAKKVSDVPKGWEKTTLGQRLKIGRGSSPRPIQDYLTDSGIPWVKIADASASETRFIKKTKEFIREEGRSTSVKVGDLIVSNSATPGIPKFMGIDACVHDGWLVFSEYKDLDKSYLYYFFMDYRRTLEHSASGTVFVNLKTEIVKNIELLLPPIIEQRAIAGILSALDDKIELLREQNKTLEAAAQTIFKEWFVNFNFPGATGKMVDSELGEIPDGWRIFKLEEIVGTVNGYSYKGQELKEKSENALVTLKSFDRSGGFQVRGFKPFSGTPKPEQEVKLGDLVVAHTDLTQDAAVLGNSAFIFDDGGFKKMYITMDLVKIIPKNLDITKGFFYYLMSTHSFKKHCVSYANGTTVLHLSKRAIPEYEIALPKDLSLVKKFSKIAQVVTQKIINNFSQLQTLSSLRDVLLPKLIRGEIRVKKEIYNG